MARLPVVGSDLNAWGTILNQFLQVGHNAGGTNLGVMPVYNASDDAYWVGNNNTSIQSAITAAMVAGGIVYVGPGTWTFSGGVVCNADNVRIVCAGRATIFQTSASFPASTPMVWFQGPAAGQHRYGNGIENVLFVNTAGPTSAIGLQLDNTYFAYAKKVDIEGVYANNIYLNGPGGANGYGAYTSIDTCKMGAVPGGAGSGGIGILTNNHEFNYIHDCNFGWFSTAGGVGIKSQNSDILIRGNSFDECDTAVYLFFNNYNLIEGNTFDRGLTHFIYNQGCSGAKIADNHFGTFVGSGSKSIIDRSADTAGNGASLITGNTVGASTGWTNFVTELNLTAPGDVYSNNTTAGLPIVRTVGVFRNNPGYNPVGQVTAPTFPATTVAATNTTGVDVMAYIANGAAAITVIQVAGVGGTYVTTGLQIAASGWGSVRIPAGGSVKFTYASGTPTWTWFGD